MIRRRSGVSLFKVFFVLVAITILAAWITIGWFIFQGFTVIQEDGLKTLVERIWEGVPQ